MANPHTPADADAEPLVPLAVWPCGDPTQPTQDPGLLTPALARRLVTTYTHPGQLVWDRTGGLVQPAAEALDRRAATAQPAEQVRLAVALQPAPEPDWAAHDWPHTLAPGGLLAIVTRGRPDPQQPADPLGVAIAAAQQSGLGYLQHVIALTVPIRHGQLQPPSGHQQQQRSARLPAPLVAHTDVLVFTAPAPAPGPDAPSHASARRLVEARR